MTHTINILSIECDSDAVYALNEAMAVTQIISMAFHEVDDGEQALAYLRNEYPYMDAAQPDLIFLNLNLPGMSGLEVLSDINADRELKHIPIAIFTSKKDPRLLAKIQKDTLPRYVFTKPTDSDEWIYTLRCIEDVWLTLKGVAGRRER